MKVLFFFCFFLLTIPSSESRSIVTPRPQPLSSLKINNKTQSAGSCSFTVTVRTSCYSPRFTRDRISLSFGDAYGNQVYASRLDDPKSRTFEQCLTDTFQIYGPCTYQICYLYIYRSGYDGWMPHDVTVYGYNTNPASFYYNTMIPGDTWYGYNRCSGTRAASLATE